MCFDASILPVPLGLQVQNQLNVHLPRPLMSCSDAFGPLPTVFQNTKKRTII